jgi:Ser-tRNA(Ala) deacylase AlaX|tara:strand:- start:690 stop:1409 length:720 start_codon:yes stop_codon:yes gene_type:complete
MSEMLFRRDSYQREAQAKVIAHTIEGGVVLDGSIFYPKGGGQPGDSGHLRWDTQTMSIATAIKGDGDQIVLIPAEPQALPPVGAILVQELDWERRHKHMRVHTALHLLSVAVPFGVTGGSIGAGQGRLDFDMPEIPENREIIEQALQAFVEMDVVVAEEWIDQATLDASPELVKTLAVNPPRGAGQIRLVRIGRGDDQIDLQPCGGTHVARTGEIGALRLGKIEKKGRMNRRIYLHLDD